MIPSDGDEDEDINEKKTKKASPSGRKRRRASSAAAAKKLKGKNSIPSTNDAATQAATAKAKTIQMVPPKKARKSATKKAPETPSEEYVRKLRPRK